MSKEKVLTKKDCRQAAKRWLIGISTFNYETQLAPSYAFACLLYTSPSPRD